jgi:hypothetical protein
MVNDNARISRSMNATVKDPSKKYQHYPCKGDRGKTKEPQVVFVGSKEQAKTTTAASMLIPPSGEMQ